MGKKILSTDPKGPVSKVDLVRTEMGLEELRIRAEIQRESLKSIKNERLLNIVSVPRTKAKIGVLVKRGIYQGKVFCSMSELAKRIIKDLNMDVKVLTVVGELSALKSGKKVIAAGLFTKEHLEFKAY
jgi:hypothetical protein